MKWEKWRKRIEDRRKEKYKIGKLERVKKVGERGKRMENRRKGK